MLISGLWKLAAMTGVIGVGLVAVYQAQQGMDKTAITASDPADTEVLGTDPLGADPLSAAAPEEAVTATEPPDADPFDAKSLDAVNLSANDKEPAPKKLAPPADDNTEKTPSGPGLDFRAEFEDSKTETVDSSKPARLPDDLDALEAEVLKAKTGTVKSAASKVLPGAIKPFVRQARATEGEPSAPSESNDPFATEPAPPATVEATPEEVPVTSSDPFQENTVPATPAKELPLDFPETEPKSDPLPAPKKENELPAPSDFGVGPDEPKSPPNKQPELPLPTEEPTSPFPPAPPVKKRPGRAQDAVPELGHPEPMPTRSEPKLPKLPTEVPLDEFPEAPPAVKNVPRAVPDRSPEPIPVREPAPDRRPLPERNPNPNRLPDPVDSDFIGDGTVDRTSPRGVQQARVTIEKIAPQQATLGEKLVYSVIVKNVGGIDATQVIVEDRIPKGTELDGTAPRAEIIDKKLIWKIGTLRPNEEKKISIRVIPRQEGPIGSLARVSFATEVAAEIQIAAPQLSFDVKAPRQARMGETIELTFTLKNTGTAAASNLSVRDLVPAGLKHEASSDIECPIGKLAPGETREIVLSVTAVKPGKATNRATLLTNGEMTQELESVIEVIGEQLVLTPSGNTKIYVDRPAVFTNSVKNEGNAQVKQVRVSEIVPASMDFVEASDGGRFDPVQRAIHWDLGALPPGAETAVSSKLIARVPGAQQLKISASGPAGSTALVNWPVDAVGRPELQIETVSRTGTITVGDRLTSKIQLKNHGSAAATNVSLSLRLPPELKLMEVRGSQYSVRDNAIVFAPVSTIGPREQAAFEVVMEAISEADAQMNLEISADHLSKPARRSETVQIAAEVRE